MKNLKLNVLFALICSLAIVSLAGPVLADTPQQTAKTFYKWYMHELNAKRTPTENKAKMRQFCSARLAKWIRSKAYRDYDADYFISAQDWEEAWEKNIQVSNVRTTGNSASLRVTLVQSGKPGMGNRILDLKLLKQGGAWKIDRVKAKD